MLSPAKGQILYILLTRPPLSIHRSEFLVRLACMKHAASVRPEPGSNSPLSESFYFLCHISLYDARTLFCCPYHSFFESTSFFVFSYSVFKVQSLSFTREKPYSYFHKVQKSLLGLQHSAIRFSP